MFFMLGLAHHDMRRSDGMVFTVEELRDIGIAWAVLSLAFANLYGGLTNLWLIAVSGGTVGLGFVGHELAHKYMATRYGLAAEFVAFYRYLGLAFLLSFAGAIFAAPGAVMTERGSTLRVSALISAAGPVTNILLSIGFLGLGGPIGTVGSSINAWLALFNMIPVGGLDGQAVLQYSKAWFGALVITAAGLVFLV